MACALDKPEYFAGMAFSVLRRAWTRVRASSLPGWCYDSCNDLSSPESFVASCGGVSPNVNSGLTPAQSLER